MFPFERIVCLTEETVETLYLLDVDDHKRSRINLHKEYRGLYWLCSLH